MSDGTHFVMKRNKRQASDSSLYAEIAVGNGDRKKPQEILNNRSVEAVLLRYMISCKRILSHRPKTLGLTKDLYDHLHPCRKEDRKHDTIQIPFKDFQTSDRVVSTLMGTIADGYRELR